MIKGVEKRVKNILKRFELAKDDDMKLFALLILDNLNFNKSYINSLTADDIIKKIYNSDIPHFTSVLRCRQKLQEKCPGLRGKLYERRIKRAEVIKEEIINFEPETDQSNLF